jgi:hypothetical protein
MVEHFARRRHAALPEIASGALDCVIVVAVAVKADACRAIGTAEPPKAD